MELIMVKKIFLITAFFSNISDAMEEAPKHPLITNDFEFDPRSCPLPEILIREEQQKRQQSTVTAPLFTSSILAARYPDESAAVAQQVAVTPIDKEALTTRIKHDLYTKLVHDMGIMGINWLEMAHGNSALATDLQELYDCPWWEKAQEKVTALCKKWELEHITIGE